jgi:uncharacterized membrane protein (UPF0127 family)
MKVKIGNNIFNVKVRHDDKGRAEGMMGKNFTDKYNGMLFIMDDDTNCFWMKKCTIPLDVIFIEGLTISKIHHNCPPCKSKKDEDCENYCGRGRLILEIRGGSAEELKIKKGDEIKLLL